MTLKHFVLTYEAVPDMMDRRGPFREAHLAMLKNLVAAGKLELAGAMVSVPPGSMFVFRGETDADARAFAEADPYVVNGLITHWSVTEWTTVVGQTATHPV